MGAPGALGWGRAPHGVHKRPPSWIPARDAKISVALIGRTSRSWTTVAGRITDARTGRDLPRHQYLPRLRRLCKALDSARQKFRRRRAYETALASVFPPRSPILVLRQDAWRWLTRPMARIHVSLRRMIRFPTCLLYGLGVPRLSRGIRCDSWLMMRLSIYRYKV